MRCWPPVSFVPAKRLRRLSRRLDRCHRRESPACFDQAGRHKSGGCSWGDRSAEADNAKSALAEAHRVLAERRKTEHGELLNKLMAKGRYLLRGPGLRRLAEMLPTFGQGQGAWCVRRTGTPQG